MKRVKVNLVLNGNRSVGWHWYPYRESDYGECPECASLETDEVGDHDEGGYIYKCFDCEYAWAGYFIVECEDCDEPYKALFDDHRCLSPLEQLAEVAE